MKKRTKAFSKEAQKFGLERPRGILAMGISGCGKSLSAKIIASLWNLPLFRLDMNLVYSGMAGPPEAVFSRALKTMDSVAPAVLWIDEIEKADKLILLTDVEGLILDDKLISELTVSEARDLLLKIGPGMITKIYASLEAVGLGVKEIIISSGLVTFFISCFNYVFK